MNRTIIATLLLLSAAVCYGVTAPEQAAAGSLGCAGPAQSVSCAGPVAGGCGGEFAEAPVAVVYRRPGIIERLRSRRAARVERRQLRQVARQPVMVAVPVVAAPGCGG